MSDDPYESIPGWHKESIDWKARAEKAEAQAREMETRGDLWRERCEKAKAAGVSLQPYAEYCAGVRDELASLRRIVGELLEGQRHGCSLDGCDIEDLLVKHGVLEPFTATAPCSENGCLCAEVADFPMECFRRTEIGVLAVEAVRALRGKEGEGDV